MELRKALIGLLVAACLSCGLCKPAQAKYSKPYYIKVELTNQIVTVYHTENDSIARQMICSTGLQETTPRGTFYLPKAAEGERENWYYFDVYNCYAQYATRIIDNVLFHSIPCSYKSQKAVSQKALRELGQPASHGCIRLRWPDAKFIAERCAPGTRVEIHKTHKENEDLRLLLLQESYDGENGQSYQEYLGMPKSDGELGLTSTGSAVQDLQYRLRDLGIFNGEITGEYHGDTVNAVRTAQRLMDIEPTGVADAEFQRQLFSDTAPVAYNVPLKEGISGPAVRSFQQNLSDLKVYGGPIDGVYDLEVVDALKRFQAAYGFIIDSVATVEVQKAVAYEAGHVHEIFDPMGGFSFDLQEETVDFGQVHCESGIRLRSEPNVHSEILGHVSDGCRAIVLERGAEWSRIQHGSDLGYVKNKYLNNKDTANYVYRYTTPDGHSSYCIGHTKDEYLAGTVPAAESFNADSPANDINMVVSTGSDDLLLNLRQSPDVNAQILEMLPNGTAVSLLLPADEWSLVDHNGSRGYLLNQFVQAVDDDDAGQSENVVQDHTVLHAMVKPLHGTKAQVYDADSDDAEILGSLKTATYVDVLESSMGWCHISYLGHQGYMRDEDLQFMSGV